MRVYRPHSRYQAIGGETKGIQSQIQSGRGGLNVRTETREEMRAGTDWTEILATPTDPGDVLITIGRD
jgi:hypothetical protein